MSKIFRIAIDVSPLNDGNSKRGVGFYTRNLVSSLKEEIKLNPLYKNFEIVLIENCKFLPAGRQGKIKNYDLVHYPYFDPFYLTLPTKKDIPQIITIHDLIPIQFKQHFPSGIRGFLKWQIQKHKAKQSDYIITVSNYSKYVIAESLGFAADKIYVTYEGATPDFKKIIDHKKLSQIKKKYKLPEEFVFYTGDINWNKNIPSLVKACIDLNYPLVIAGKQAIDIDNLKLEKPSIARPMDLFRHLLDIPSPQLKHLTTLKKIFHSPLVYRLGFVDSEDLPFLYNLATIYCQPSYAEGFGLCPLEAMQSGTPVVYSSDTSLPEIMGEAGISFNPYSTDGLISSLKKLWIDKTLQDQQIKMGINRSKFFSWKQTAKQTLAVYDLALSR
ncbi:glycosyltransferase family 4 protein [Candidatus Shapirobacteria bacterium]|nr:glycosyltransferase family 4 protein [Candidatus Shapirobacteria bacterium]